MAELPGAPLARLLPGAPGLLWVSHLVQPSALGGEAVMSALLKLSSPLSIYILSLLCPSWVLTPAR